MNEDIAYSVLSFLENPKSYARVSRAFKAGSVYAQKEYIANVKRAYPLLSMTLDEAEARLYPMREKDEYVVYKKQYKIHKMMWNLVIFHMNKMVLNKHWDTFRAVIALIDPIIVRGIFSDILDILHINGNDEMAARLWRQYGEPYTSVVSQAQQRYYTFYSSEPTDEKARLYPVCVDAIGYVPEEVIAYWDKHPEGWADRRSTTQDILPAIMRRGFLPDEQPSSTLTCKNWKMYNNYVWGRIVSIARDHPYENVDTLITYFTEKEVATTNICGITALGVHKDSVPMNRRVLKYVKDRIPADRYAYLYPYDHYDSSPIVIAYLQILWLNDPTLLRSVQSKAQSSKNSRRIEDIPSYIAVQMSQKIPINEEDLLNSFAYNSLSTATEVMHLV